MGVYNKFWVALGMTVVNFIQAQQGVDLGVDQATMSGLVSMLTALLVYAVPNTPSTNVK